MYPMTQDYNGERWRYSGVLKQVTGNRLVTYRDMKTDTKFICYLEVDGNLVEWSLADEILRRFEEGEINK